MGAEQLETRHGAGMVVGLQHHALEQAATHGQVQLVGGVEVGEVEGGGLLQHLAADAGQGFLPGAGAVAALRLGEVAAEQGLREGGAMRRLLQQQPEVGIERGVGYHVAQVAEAAHGVGFGEQDFEAGPGVQVPEAVGAQVVEGQREVGRREHRRGAEVGADGFEGRDELGGDFDAVVLNGAVGNAFEHGQQ